MGERARLRPVVGPAPGAVVPGFDRARPVALAREQTLPVVAPLTGLFPAAALPRGITATITGPGAASLALALAAAPSAAGSWTALVGLAGTGLAAAAELGVALERVAVVAPPAPAEWPGVVAALIGAFDLILMGPRHRVPPAAARRLVARARERGTVLVFVTGPLGAGRLDAWPEGPDLRLVLTGSVWHGLDDGHGHLRWRQIQVEASGRRALARPRRVDLLLPGPAGRIEVVDRRAADDPVGLAPVARRVG
jgi:hypothetical protein